MSKTKACPRCNGSGREACGKCLGTKQVVYGYQKYECPKCFGRGDKTCSKCGGSGRVPA